MKPVLIARQSTLLATTSLFGIGVLLSIPNHAHAQCAPDPASDGATVTCATSDTDGFQSASDDLTVTINSGVTVSRPTETVLVLGGQNANVTNNGTISVIDPTANSRIGAALGENGIFRNATDAIVTVSGDRFMAGVRTIQGQIINEGEVRVSGAMDFDGLVGVFGSTLINAGLIALEPTSAGIPGVSSGMVGIASGPTGEANMLTNNGEISIEGLSLLGFAGMRVEESDATDTITNGVTGLIRVQSDVQPDTVFRGGAGIDAGANDVVINEGEIIVIGQNGANINSADNAGIRAGDNVSITNSNRIATEGDLAPGVAFRLSLVADPMGGRLVNSGTIETLGSGMGVFSEGGELGVQLSGSPAVFVPTANTEIVNSGTIIARGDMSAAVMVGGDVPSVFGAFTGSYDGNEITNSGMISGTDYGVHLIGEPEFGTPTLTIDNQTDGTIRATQTDGTAVRAVAGNLIVTNAGQVNGDTGIEAAGTADVTNSGRIQGTESDGIRADNGGIVRNQDDGLIAGSEDGVDINGGTFEVINSGEITAANFDAIDIADATGTVRNLTGGVLEGLFQGIYVASGTVTVKNQANATIGSDFNGIRVESGSIEITNTGTIEGRGDFGDGIGIWLETAGTVINQADGTITGFDDGILLDSPGTTITNWGLIEAVESDGMDLNQGGTVINRASGIIRGPDDGIDVDGGAFDITNAGLIAGNIMTVSSVNRQGIDIEDATGTVRNQATGIVRGLEGVSVSGSVTGPIIIFNEGLIEGTDENAILIDNDADMSIENSGRLIGDVRLGGGNDTLVLLAGSEVDGRIRTGGGDDTVRLVPTAQVSGSVDLGSGDDVLIFDGASGTTGQVDLLAGTVPFAVGVDRVEKRGQGTWVLQGEDIPASFSLAPIFFVEGTGIINASAPSANVTVSNGATLGGTGTAGDVTNSGTFSPGNSIGTFTVAGDLVLGADGTLAIEIEAPNMSDLVVVSGTTMLGGTLSVTGIGALEAFALSQTYTIIDSAGAVSGAFATVTDTLPDLDVVPQTVDGGDGGQEVVLGLVAAGSTPGPAPALSDKAIVPNTQQGQISTGRLFAGALAGRTSGVGGGQSAVIDDGTINAYLPDQSTPGFALPEGVYSADAGLGHFAARPVRTAWISALGGFGQADATAFAPAYDADTFGVAGGVDIEGTAAGFGWLVGGAVGYTRSDIASGAASADVDTFHLGAYGRIEQGPARLSAQVSYGFQDYDFTRLIPVGGTAVTAAGTADGHLFTASVTGAYDIAPQLGWGQQYRLRVAPTATLGYVHTNRNGFTETGAGVLNQAYGATDFGRTYLRAGVELGTEVDLGDGATLRPRGGIHWEWGFGDNNILAGSTAPAVPGSAFASPGAVEGDGGLIVEAGFDVDLSRTVSAQFNYEGAFSNSGDSHRLSGGLKINF